MSCSSTQHSDDGEALTHSPSVSTSMTEPLCSLYVLIDGMEDCSQFLA